MLLLSKLHRCAGLTLGVTHAQQRAHGEAAAGDRQEGGQGLHSARLIRCLQLKQLVLCNSNSNNNHNYSNNNQFTVACVFGLPIDAIADDLRERLQSVNSTTPA